MTAEKHALSLDDVLAIADAGWALHPLVPGTKAPGTKRGFKDATRDHEQLTDWWEARPDVGWGTPTGDVADIDRPDQLDIELPADAPCQQTPSGGRHILMAPSGRRLPGKLPGEAGEWRPDGRAYVKIYEPAAFINCRPESLPEVPEAAFAPLSAPAAGDEEPLSLTAREELLSLIGKLRDAGLERDDIYELLEKMKGDGRIYDSDASDPWTNRHFRQLAGEAGKWQRGRIIAAPRLRGRRGGRGRR